MHMKMEDNNWLLILSYVCLTLCNAQSFGPANLTAVYVADGTIRVTWDPPIVSEDIDLYFVQVMETGEYGYPSAGQRVYQYYHAQPDTKYTFHVSATSSHRGSSITTITTPPAMYGQNGTRTRLTLPKVPDDLSSIVFNGQILFTFLNGDIVDGNSSSENDVTVELTSTKTKLTIYPTEADHAGYYYTMRTRGNMVIGGQTLVVTAQSFGPANLTSVYVADGTIRVTWDHPTTTGKIDGYDVEVEETDENHSLSAGRRLYKYSNPRPNTAYTFNVLAVSAHHKGSSFTTVTTPPAIYGRKGTWTGLTLPKPPDGLSFIVLNSQTLFGFLDNDEVGGNTRSENGVTVNVTSANTELAIASTEVEHAGYYYIIRPSENIILGGQMLVVTDTPTQPSITSSNRSPVVDKSVTLGCSSKSRSKPDNHGLVLKTTWKLNGSDINHVRFSVKGYRLIINRVVTKDKYNIYTCVAWETGTGFIGTPSKESVGYNLTPRYGPQFINIEGTEGKSIAIRGNGYGPVVCRTDCNPACRMRWWRQGIFFKSSRRGSLSNQLELVDRLLPRTREITYTCQASVVSSAGFSKPKLEKNITVVVYYPPYTRLRFRPVVNRYMPFDRTNSMYTQGSSLELRVDVDSNPPGDVTLSRDQTTVAVYEPVLSGIHYIKIDNLQCNHSGWYQVKAANFVTRNRSNINSAIKHFGIQVSCAPRRRDTTHDIIKIAGELGHSVTLDVSVVANPRPTSQWSDGVTALDVLQNNGYTYTITGRVSITSDSDFQIYHVNVTNALPGVLTVHFQIIPEEQEHGYANVYDELPDIPTNHDLKSKKQEYDYTITDDELPDIPNKEDIQTEKTPHNPDPQLHLTIGLVISGVVVLVSIVVITAMVIKRTRRLGSSTYSNNGQGHTDVNINRSRQAETVQLHSRVTIHGRRHDVEQEQGYANVYDELPDIATNHYLQTKKQEHDYAIVDDELPDIPTNHEIQTEKQEYDYTIADDELPDIPNKQDLQTENDNLPTDDDGYLKMPGDGDHGHKYHSINRQPQSSDVIVRHFRDGASRNEVISTDVHGYLKMPGDADGESPNEVMSKDCHGYMKMKRDEEQEHDYAIVDDELPDIPTNHEIQTEKQEYDYTIADDELPDIPNKQDLQTENDNVPTDEDGYLKMPRDSDHGHKYHSINRQPQSSDVIVKHFGDGASRPEVISTDIHGYLKMPGDADGESPNEVMSKDCHGYMKMKRDEADAIELDILHMDDKDEYIKAEQVRGQEYVNTTKAEQQSCDALSGRQDSAGKDKK